MSSNPKINVFVAPPPGDMARPFGILPNTLEFSRVPCVGELVALGVDEEDQEATYRIVLVTHIPKGLTFSEAVAEVHAVRVDAPRLATAAVAAADLHGGAPLKLPVGRR